MSSIPSIPSPRSDPPAPPPPAVSLTYADARTPMPRPSTDPRVLCESAGGGVTITVLPPPPGRSRRVLLAILLGVPAAAFLFGWAAAAAGRGRPLEGMIDSVRFLAPLLRFPTVWPVLALVVLGVTVLLNLATNERPTARGSTIRLRASASELEISIDGPEGSAHERWPREGLRSVRDTPHGLLVALTDGSFREVPLHRVSEPARHEILSTLLFVLGLT